MNRSKLYPFLLAALVAVAAPFLVLADIEDDANIIYVSSYTTDDVSTWSHTSGVSGMWEAYRTYTRSAATAVPTYSTTTYTNYAVQSTLTNAFPVDLTRISATANYSDSENTFVQQHSSTFVVKLRKNTPGTDHLYQLRYTVQRWNGSNYITTFLYSVLAELDQGQTGVVTPVGLQHGDIVCSIYPSVCTDTNMAPSGTSDYIWKEAILDWTDPIIWD